MEKDVLVVVRTVGERTEEICRQLILRQVPEKNVIVVSNKPFSATLADSYRAGIERGLKWTLCVDADILLRPDAVATLLAIGGESEDNVCEIQGMVLDKLFGGPRQGGPHLYRTALLSEAIALIPKEGLDLRPEHFTLNRMKESGYTWVEVPTVLGLHDFEQYYRDIYRKCFVQAHKHDYLMGLFVGFWRKMSAIDPDYRVALLGLAAGIVETGEVRIDTSKFTKGIDFLPGGAGWKEKKAIDFDSIVPEDIERIISEWKEPEEYFKYFPPKMKIKPKTAREKLCELKREIGILRLMLWLIGWCFYKAGLKIKNKMADKSKKK